MGSSHPSENRKTHFIHIATIISLTCCTVGKPYLITVQHLFHCPALDNWLLVVAQRSTWRSRAGVLPGTLRAQDTDPWHKFAYATFYVQIPFGKLSSPLWSVPSFPVGKVVLFKRYCKGRTPRAGAKVLLVHSLMPYLTHAIFSRHFRSKLVHRRELRQPAVLKPIIKVKTQYHYRAFVN